MIVVALLAHALVPHYEYRNYGSQRGVFTRIDRWTGGAQVVHVNTGTAGDGKVEPYW